MKSSIIRGLVMFFAGAGCATVVAGLYPPIEPITPELFQERLTAVLVEVDALGGYVGLAENGRIGIFTNVGACLPPVPPPKWPAHAVDQRSLEIGFKAAVNLNLNYLAEEGNPVYVLGKCRPYAQSILK
jgi:hypothetical protein